MKRYGLMNKKEMTQKEIAKELKISRSYVSRIEKRALTKILKEFIKNLPISEPLGKKSLQSIIAQVFKRYKTTETSTMLDKLKNLGFEYSTYSGITMSAFDIIADSNKEQIISDGKKKVEQIGKQYKRGLITEQERYERVIEVWNNANEQIKNDLSKSK